MTDKTASVIIGVVTAIWAGNIVAGVVQWNGYTPSESVNGIFMAIVGGAFAYRARAKSSDKSDDKSESGGEST